MSMSGSGEREGFNWGLLISLLLTLLFWVLVVGLLLWWAPWG